MALKLNCLEHLTAIGIGVGACALAPFDAGLTAGAVIGGAGLFSRIRENMRKAGLDDKAAIERMQKAILREWDRWQATQEYRDAVTEADAAMTRLLPQLMMTREELAATATKSPDAAYPKAAAREVVDRLATHDAIFATPADKGAEPPLARRFALEAVERALRAAKEDKDYATLLTLDIAIELARAIAETLQAVNELRIRIDAGFAAVQASLGSEFERLSVQAMRGAVARFVVLKPDATMSELVQAIEQFVPQYEDLRARVAALEADDNRLKGAQQGARHALDLGDLDAARRYLAEAADIQVERAAEPARQAAAMIDELARADLLALDWQSADANWSRASAMLEPFDLAAAETLAEDAAEALAVHGERFARSASIAAAIGRLQVLAGSAAARGEEALWAGRQNNLGIALRLQAVLIGDEAELALLAQSVEAYRAALTVYTKAATPADWAMAQNNLGNALQNQGACTEGKAGLALLAQAVEAYRAALTVYTKAALPVDWAMAQNNLANTLALEGDRTRGEKGLALLAQAVEAYRAALTVYTEAASPIAWAGTQNNLGTALKAQGARTNGKAGLKLLSRAVEAYRAALTVRTEAAMPALWAMTMENLATYHEHLADRTPAPQHELRAAQDALVAVLRVYTPEHVGRYHDTASASLARIRAKIAALAG